MLRSLAPASVLAVSALAALSLAACTDDDQEPAPTIEGTWRLVPHAALPADQPLSTWTFGADGMLTIARPGQDPSVGPYVHAGGFLDYQPGDVPSTTQVRVYASLGRERLLIDAAQPLGATVGVAGTWSEVMIRDGQAWNQTYVVGHDLSLQVTSQVPGSADRITTGQAVQFTGSQFEFRYGDAAATLERPVYALNGAIGFILLERQ